MNILCICTYFKGISFLEAAKAEGNYVILITHKKLETKAWPWSSIDEVHYLDHVDNISSTYDTLVTGVSNILKKIKIDVVAALDDFDVEKGALIRESFRINGMGQTTARYFRDKLAMRFQAQDNNINVPAFVSLFNDIDITEFLQKTEGPWLVKPRSEASAAGIKKVYNLDEAWGHIHSLGESRHQFLLECFKPGDVYHVDALIVNHEIVFEQSSQYINTPFEVAHGGGIFRSVTVKYGSDDDLALKKLNEKIIEGFRMKNGVVHTEIIKNRATGAFYFLETASRVGGAHLSDMVEAATDINLWSEWAKIETAIFNKRRYKAPKRQKLYSGILVTLSSHQWPDQGIFNDPEVCWKMNEEHHIGVIVKSKSQEKVMAILEKYAEMIKNSGLHASAPAPDKPTH